MISEYGGGNDQDDDNDDNNTGKIKREKKIYKCNVKQKRTGKRRLSDFW